MAADSQVPHRPGAYKQQNKAHKTGRHRSKGQLQKEAKGRVSVKTLTKKAKKITTKQDRRNRAVQVRKNKRDDVLAKKRSRGGPTSPPFIVGMVSLCSGVDMTAALQNIKTCDDTVTVVTNDLNVTHISLPRFKQRFSFIIPEYGDLYALLDMAKVADCVLFVASAEGGIDNYGSYCMSCMFAQGLPTPVMAVQGLKGTPVRKQMEAKKMIQKHLERRLPGEKLHALDTPQDGLLMLRTIGTLKLRPIALRDYRPHMLAESVSFELQDPQSSVGTLKVSGYIRSKALSVNQLVHLPGWGDFQLLQIDAPDDPYLASKPRHNQDAEMGSAEVRVLEKADPSRQVSLVSEVVPDPMEGEQTWPTEEELAEAEKQRKVVKRVPKGTSEYQAAWIIDSGDEKEDEDGSEDEEEHDMEIEDDTGTMGSESEDGDMEDEQSDEDGEEYEEVTLEDAVQKYDATIDKDEEKMMLEKYKEARMHQMFPDEVDTPMDTPARVRFQRYRGLKSYRTSPWDPKENLPIEYARIFQFENFRRARKRILAEDGEDGALPGWYVTLHVANVPRAFMESYQPGMPVLVYGILPHEQKMSVIHFLLKRHHGNSEPIKSKERMIFHVGYRRYAACPVYSQHTNGSKHKYERFFNNETTIVATVYAPIIFSPSSVLMFKETQEGNHEMVAMGCVLSVNPDRIITKRAVLSGHPFKISRRLAVVRYMFFNREDIQWFKPIELRTKWGKRGHIKEPLGTHGHVKCVFDKQLTSMDTVLMSLYKRVFPKWTYEPAITAPPHGFTAPTSSTAAIEGMEDFFD